VELEGGAKERVKVRQIKVAEYRRALGLSDDELALIAIVCDRDTQWVERLTPDSYQRLVAEFRGTSWAFFEYCERTVADRLARIPKEVAASLFNPAAQSATPARPSRRSPG